MSIDIYEPTLLAIPDTPVNALLKVRILRPAWSDLVRSLARHERHFVLHVLTLRDRGALYHAINRYNLRHENEDSCCLRLNSLALINSSSSDDAAKSRKNQQWLITLVRRGLSEEDNLRTYTAMGRIADNASMEISSRYHFLVHMLVALEGGFIPAPKDESQSWKKLRNQMRKFIRKRAALNGFNLDQSGNGETAWVGATDDPDSGNILLSYSPFAQEVWRKIKMNTALADREEPDTDTAEE